MKITRNGKLVSIEHHVSQRASWKAYGDGLASIKIDSHEERKHLSITVEETHLARKVFGEKRDVTRAASIALDEIEALALFEALKAHFEPAIATGDGAVIVKTLASHNAAVRAAVGGEA